VAAIRRHEGKAVTFPKKLAIAIAATAAAASLSACATSPMPGSPEEQLYFDKAVGADINHIPPQVRVEGAIGYPRTDGPGYRPPPGFGWR
jgi:hypothetical protein